MEVHVENVDILLPRYSFYIIMLGFKAFSVDSGDVVPPKSSGWAPREMQERLKWGTKQASRSRWINSLHRFFEIRGLQPWSSRSTDLQVLDHSKIQNSLIKWVNSAYHQVWQRPRNEPLIWFSCVGTGSYLKPTVETPDLYSTLCPITNQQSIWKTDNKIFIFLLGLLHA